MKHKTHTVKLTVINIMMFGVLPCDRLTNNQRMEYQPEDTQVSTARGCMYVPSLDVLYLGLR